MSARFFIALAAGGSAAVLLAAYGFQHLGGLAPCKMCLWQRWPHAAAILIGVLAFVVPVGTRVWAVLGALAALVTAGIGLYHVGVEQAWWKGPSSCSAQSIGGLSTDELLDQIMSAPLVRCDEIAWSFAGLSMAGWNAVLSLGLAVIWVMAFRKA
ncbi:disulfide bond formation protein B [Pseudaestuariivita sp.]|uniref:disulfide bond formation protein B n=1 Tax=Pseudaestuariivita sp. TaxID=2211669 RepID=UPI0040597C5D